MNHLEEAVALLLQTQASCLARQAETDSRHNDLERSITEQFGRIEERFTRIEQILLEHNRILEALPDAVREKIGFKSS